MKLHEVWVNRETGIWLHRLNGDGTESRAADAKRYYTSKKDAIDHHNHMVAVNPNRRIVHNLHVNTSIKHFVMKLDGKHEGTGK